MKRMFRLFTGLLTTMLVLSSVSCKKTDDTAPDSKGEATILGKWVSVSVQMQTYVGDRLIEEETLIFEGGYQTIELLEDGTGFIAEVVGKGSDVIPIVWKHDGNRLTLTYIEGLSIILDVVSMDASQLILQHSEEYSSPKNSKVVETMYFKRE
ncbi:MAG: hypothetical protein J6A22_02500 [Bacteroidales bacterium]|nr:hypothetical protein [Bacteroidales bacterium]